MTELGEAEDAAAGLDAGRFDLVLLQSASAERTVEQLRLLRAARRDAKVIVVAGDPAPEGVLAAMREHAFAYFRAPIEPDSVAQAIARALGAPDWRDAIEVISARPEGISERGNEVVLVKRLASGAGRAAPAAPASGGPA